MPRPRNDNTASPHADGEHGFAALEAKVEEMQVEAAIEAELSVEDAATAFWPEASPAPVPMALAGAAPAPATLFGAVEEWTQSVVRFQADTLTDFAGVRRPQDLLTAQVAYGARALEFYLAALTRMGRTAPALWASVPGLAPHQSR